MKPISDSATGGEALRNEIPIRQEAAKRCGAKFPSGKARRSELGRDVHPARGGEVNRNTIPVRQSAPKQIWGALLIWRNVPSGARPLRADAAPAARAGNANGVQSFSPGLRVSELPWVCGRNVSQP